MDIERVVGGQLEMGRDAQEHGVVALAQSRGPEEPLPVSFPASMAIMSMLVVVIVVNVRVCAREASLRVNGFPRHGMRLDVPSGGAGGDGKGEKGAHRLFYLYSGWRNPQESRGER